MILKPGITMMHEHVRLDLSRIKHVDDTNLNCKEETIKEFKELYNLGVRNIIEVTNYGMGQEIDYINQVAKATDINIITSTGFYKDPFLPDYFVNKTIEELAAIMIDDLVNKNAKVIGEIGTSNNEWTENEHKLFNAVVIAQRKTNAVIYTHTTLGTLANQQADFFISENINPDKVVIGHVCLAKDLNSIKKLINKGFNVGFDTIGKNNYFPDESRAEFLKDLQDSNMIDHVVMSMDITRKSNMKYKGGIGYTYLFSYFIPLIKSYGITEESIIKILVDNPKRIFGEE
jgi:phosphotriesterase-related protein